MIRTLVVDDTILFRKIVAEALQSFPDVTIVGSASSGESALKILGLQEVDLVFCDIHMPGLNGLETLDRIKHHHPNTIVVMMSGISTRSADITISALEHGALDFIQKPAGATADESITRLRGDLGLVLRLVQTKMATARILAGRPLGRPAATPRSERPASSPSKSPFTYGIVAVGVSTGGPEALNRFVPELPSTLGVPVVLVQHMPAGFTRSLAESLAKKSRLSVVEAQDGQALEPDVVYIAPGGRHMVIRTRDNKRFLGLNDEPAENSCRPSVDVLFRSVAASYDHTGVIAAILTGMGNDGLAGVRALKRRGCYCITQESSSCVVYGMPRAVDEAGLSDISVPIEDVAPEICRRLGRS